MGILVGSAPFFSRSFRDDGAPIVFDDDDDLPPENPELAARYASMTDDELLVEVWAMAQPRAVQ